MTKKKSILKIIRNIFVILAGIILLLLIIRGIGMQVNNRTPSGGINESMYMNINDTNQWINIYGEDRNNPVLLYLHGGPGSATSPYDYAFTRQWADIYTVVTWDQRNCGKSYDENQNDMELTYELMISDGLEITKYIRDYFDVDKITLLGHSWGTYLGCNLVLTHPEYYDCYIGTGQLVDMYKNEVAFQKVASEWVGEDEEGLKLLNLITPEHLTAEHFTNRNLLMEKYGYDLMRDGTDYNKVAAEVFNPYYSLKDWMSYLNSNYRGYMDFILSEEFEKFSLMGKTNYKVPYFNINGNKDYQTNYKLAQEYFDQITAPHKEMYIMEDTTHGLLESKSNEFSDILHLISIKQE